MNALLSRALGEKDFKKANDVAMNGAFLKMCIRDRIYADSLGCKRKRPDLCLI